MVVAWKAASQEAKEMQAEDAAEARALLVTARQVTARPEASPEAEIVAAAGFEVWMEEGLAANKAVRAEAGGAAGLAAVG